MQSPVAIERFASETYSLGKSKVVTERSDSVTTQIVSLVFVR
jgi:hypothetical protein